MKKFLSVVLITVAVAFSTAGCQEASVGIGKPRPQICWFVALDLTRSISEDRFDIMRNEMIPELVLSRIKNNDEVHLINLDDDPEDDVDVFVMRGGKTGLKNEALKVWEKLKSVKQSRAAKFTNIGAALRYISSTVSENSRERERLNDNRPEAINIAIVLTDGKPTGKQTKIKNTPGGDIHLWFYGIDKPEQIPDIKSFCSELGFSVQCVPYGYWKRRALHFAEEFGRRQDRSIVKSIKNPGENHHDAAEFIF